MDRPRVSLLTELSMSERKNIWHPLYVESKKNEINELTYKQKETHRLRQWTYGSWGEGWEEGIVREFGIDMYILLYLKQITNKDLFCTAHGMLCDSLDGRGVWGRMDTNICTAESPLFTWNHHSIACYLTIPQYKIKSFKNKQKELARERQPNAIQILCTVL